MKKKSGFTFIEVALVLAIAGLIFLMAFLALPSLWMSQRDADRKARVMEFVSDIKTYQTNNSRGALPVFSSADKKDVFTFKEAREENEKNTTSWKAMIRDYVSPDFADATGNEYNFYIVGCLDQNGSDTIGVGHPCDYADDEGDYETENGHGEYKGLHNVNTDIETPVDGTLYVVVGATCDGDQAVKTNSSRSVAVMQVLERAGRYCYNT